MIYINNKYILLEKIGVGSFGSIYKGENIRTKEKVAIKIEDIRNETKLLKNESIIYTHLQKNNSNIGIPQFKWFGKDELNYYMVITLFGDSLQTIKNEKQFFSLPFTLQIGIHILNILRNIHDCGLIHRDIKPDNFLLGLNDKRNQIHIIDFGFCKPFVKEDQHIQMKKTNNLIGSLTYASINAHNYDEQSRRDDLESLGYMLLYFYLGDLEWKHEIDCNILEKNRRIQKMKENVIHNKKIPHSLLLYLNNVKSLTFEERPNYNMLIEMFMQELTKK